MLDLTEYTISQRGFLPPDDPPLSIKDYFEEKGYGKLSVFDEMEVCAELLNRFLVTGRAREDIFRMAGNIDCLLGSEEYKYLMDTAQQDAIVAEHFMRLLSFLGHAYILGSPQDKPTNTLCKGIAVPWHRLASMLGRLPVLSYASYALHNWWRLDETQPVALGNIMLTQNFLGGMDEDWFILIHIDIEAKAGVIPQLALDTIAACRSQDAVGVEMALSSIHGCLENIYATMERMTELCDPYIYYHRVRPYIHGWKNNPVLPDGVIYEGVDAYKGKPQQFRGETGAQSSIVPLLDTLLGVEHQKDQLWEYLQEMRLYMPKGHRSFLEDLHKEHSGVVRSYVERLKKSHPAREAHAACLERLKAFRTLHVTYAKAYIARQNEVNGQNSTTIGTGGTPFVPYLEKHRDDTK